ncbi:ribonuclease H-like domain, reverse transcriptase, RNA-dependent DNA polymerase [Tanacetum coccineum]
MDLLSIQPLKKYIKLTEQEQLQDDCDVQATNIVLQGLPPDVYALVNHCLKIKKVNEKVYAAQVGCEVCKRPHYSKDCPLKEEGKTLEEAYYTQFSVPFQQGLQYRVAAPGFYQRNNGNSSYQERRQTMEEPLSNLMTESTKRHEENSNLIKVIRASTTAAIRNQGASIKALEIQIGQMSKVLQERGYGNLPSSTETNPRDHVKSISTTVDVDTTPISCIGPGRYAVSGTQNSKLFFVPRHAAVPFPSRLYDDCYNEEEESCLGKLAPTKLIVELADITVKHPKGIAENVLVGIDKFVFPVDFIVLDMPEDIKTPLILGRPFLCIAHAKIDVFKRKEALILNRSQDSEFGDFRELNDLNEPLKLRRNQVEDLEPTIEEGEVIDEPMMDIVKTRCDDEIISGLDEYPKFIVMENMNAYCDEGMGDIIIGRPLCREACVKARRLDGMITIYNGNDSVTYQMARSHPRFKHLINAQCNKMRPLLKISAQYELNGISHPYQKLKGFYKGVLNLGPEYLRDVKMEEWLTHGHVSTHEME